MISEEAYQLAITELAKDYSKLMVNFCEITVKFEEMKKMIAATKEK